MTFLRGIFCRMNRLLKWLCGKSRQGNCGEVHTENEFLCKCPRVILWSCIVLGSYASKEAKHHGLSCCVISIYNRVEAVRQLRQIRKDKSTNDRIPWHPSKHCRSSGGKGLQHAYTTAYMAILSKKKKGRACVCMKPTRYIVNWQCFYFYGCSEYPVFLPYCSVCC